MATDIQQQYDMIEYGDERVYLPTPAEQRLLQTLLDPDRVSMTIKEKLVLGDVSYPTYYKAMAKPAFLEIYRDLMVAGLQGKAPKVIQATYEYAIGDRRNSRDRDTILKVLGILEDKKKIDITKKSLNVTANFDNMATDDIKDIIKEMIREDPTLIEGMGIVKNEST